ncbi:hypothetical protein FPZ49_18455 [Paenibacillus cremeus]|uniref:Uncharacterized protein n=2 Tax=Paenibacillus cremeus TaxID=2163881 RepID=A0A559K8S9_9BACL|nr:hypothetical protein FPZ49_18455 [Paenibacillus cremeus]
MDLMERLAMHLKMEVALQAEGFESDPGVLDKVGRRFIQVNDQYFVPHTLQEIVLLGLPYKGTGTQINLRTTYGGLIPASLIRTGTDFVEIIRYRQEDEEDLRLLIPLNKVIGIEEE